MKGDDMSQSLSVSPAGPPPPVRPEAGASINPLYPALLYGNINQRRRPHEEWRASIKCVFERDSHAWRRKKECLGVKSRLAFDHADKDCCTQAGKDPIKRWTRCHG